MFATESNRYLELLQQFPPRPIKSEGELLAVQAVIDALLDAGEMTPEQQDYINVLGTLVHEYEDKHTSVPDLSGVALLKALMNEFGLRPADLVPVFNSESIVSAILDGQHQLTVAHIEKLSHFFKVSPSLFFARSS